MDLIAPVASAAAARQPAHGEGGLTAGQVFQARVARVDGDQVRLQWGDQRFSVSSRVPLSVGQQVSLMVEEGASGKMLLRMVDDTFGKGRQPRADGTGRASGTPAPAAGSQRGPVTAIPGRDARGASDGRDPDGGQSDAGGPGGASGSAGRPVDGAPLQGRTNGTPGPAAGPRGNSAPPGTPGTGSPTGGQLVGTPWTPGSLGQPGLAASADALTTLLFEPLDSTAARLAGGTRPAGPEAVPPGGAGTAARAVGTATGSQQTAPRPGQSPVADGAAGLIAKAAIPTYGRLAQSVGGAVAFGQLLAMNGQEIGQTLARASLAPASLGRLLIDIGVHPDEMNAVLVGELLAQGETVQESNVRGLRRELAAAGGSLRDAAPAVALARLGLPITPLSLAVARQMQAGQLHPGAAWGELLNNLQQLARGGDAGSQAGVLAAEMLADWRVPLEEGAGGIGRWLRTAVDQAATPLEAKLVRPLAGDGSLSPAHTSAGQDVRARLDLLTQALPLAGRGDRSMLAASLQRVQATVQAEQLLNGSSTTGTPAERTEPRFFAVTLPTVMGQQLSSLELRVRERDARPGRPGEPARPDVVQLKLSLPGLGDLGVNLTVGQHSVACHFSASSLFAEALLNASSAELVGRLKRLGYGHTSVDAAHEPPEATAPVQSATPRLHQVDLTA